ncbi:MAG: transposase [Chryseolinea sp.]
MHDRKVMFNLVFEAAPYTLNTFARDPEYMNASAGISSVLHTWEQLSFHSYVHCIVTGSGWRNNDHQWVEARKAKYKVLFSVQAMGKVYCVYFIKHLDLLKQQGHHKITNDQKAGWYNFIHTLRSKEWVVYAKEPFGGPAQVIEYLRIPTRSPFKASDQQRIR